MLGGLLGKKIGMSQVFGDDGRVVPVTVIEAGPCTITQVKTEETDGYQAIQLGFGEIKRLNKPLRGHLKDSQHGRYLREVRTDDAAEFLVGQRVEVDIFEPGELVDVIGRSKGRGFAGVMKRHGFSGGPRTHGQSDRARAPGSIGGGTTPGKVFKGMRMAGHMGDQRVTAKNLEVVRVDPERNLLLVKGGVPGAPNGLLLIQKTGKPVTTGRPTAAPQKATTTETPVAEPEIDDTSPAAELEETTTTEAPVAEPEIDDTSPAAELEETTTTEAPVAEPEIDDTSPAAELEETTTTEAPVAEPEIDDTSSAAELEETTTTETPVDEAETDDSR